MKMGENTVWSCAEMKLLLEQVQDSDASSKKVSIKSAIGSFNWAEVSVPGRSPGDCMKGFETIFSFIKKSMTLADICQLAKNKLSEEKIPKAMVPNAPKMPLSPLFMFIQERSKKMMKKDPNLKLIEASKMATKKWYKLSASKQAKYHRKREELMAEYKQANSKISTGHKKFVGKLTVDGWFSVQNDLPLKQSRSTFNSLSDGKKLVWINQTIEEFRRRKAAHDADPDKTTTPPTLQLKDEFVRLLHKSENIHEKPPKTLMAYYCRGNSTAGLTKEQKTKKYLAMSDIEHDVLAKMYIKELEDFIKAVTSYVDKYEGIMTKNEADTWQFYIFSYRRCLNAASKRRNSIQSKKRKMADSDSSSDSDSDNEEGSSKSVAKKKKTHKKTSEKPVKFFEAPVKYEKKLDSDSSDSSGVATKNNVSDNRKNKNSIQSKKRKMADSDSSSDSDSDNEEGSRPLGTPAKVEKEASSDSDSNGKNDTKKESDSSSDESDSDSE